MLRSLTREFLTRESTPRAVRTLMEDPRGLQRRDLAADGRDGLAGPGDRRGLRRPGAGHDRAGAGARRDGPRGVSRARSSPPSVLAASAIAAGGQDNQMARYLPDIASGRTKATLALIEDALSWTPSGVKLRAERRGDEFVLSGTKRFVPFAHVADLMLVAARTGDGRRRHDRLRRDRRRDGLEPDAERGDGSHQRAPRRLVLDSVPVAAGRGDRRSGSRLGAWSVRRCSARRWARRPRCWAPRGGAWR